MFWKTRESLLATCLPMLRISDSSFSRSWGCLTKKAPTKEKTDTFYQKGIEYPFPLLYNLIAIKIHKKTRWLYTHERQKSSGFTNKFRGLHKKTIQYICYTKYARIRLWDSDGFLFVEKRTLKHSFSFLLLLLIFKNCITVKNQVVWEPIFFPRAA